MIENTAGAPLGPVPDSRQYDTFEDWLHATISALGITAARLATISSVPPATVYRWLGRKPKEKFSFLSSAMAQRLHESLGVSLEELERLKPSIAARAEARKQAGATLKARYPEALEERGRQLAKRTVEDYSKEQRTDWAIDRGKASARSARAKTQDPELHRRTMEDRWPERSPLGSLIVDAAVEAGLTVKDWSLRHDLVPGSVHRILQQPATAVLPYRLELLALPLGKSVDELEAITNNTERLRAGRRAASKAKIEKNGDDFYTELARRANSVFMRKYDRTAREAMAKESNESRRRKLKGQKRTPQQIERMRIAQRKVADRRAKRKAAGKIGSDAAAAGRTADAQKRIARVCSAHRASHSGNAPAQTTLEKLYNFNRSVIRDHKKTCPYH